MLDFKGVKLIMTFICNMEEVFEILNSRNSLGKSNKESLKLINKNHGRAELLINTNYMPVFIHLN